jgi:hypothetical protein
MTRFRMSRSCGSRDEIASRKSSGPFVDERVEGR